MSSNAQSRCVITASRDAEKKEAPGSPAKHDIVSLGPGPLRITLGSSRILDS